MKTFANAYAILDIEQNELFPSIGDVPMLFRTKAQAEHRANICEIADWAIITVEIISYRGLAEIGLSNESDCSCGVCSDCADMNCN